MTDVRWPPLTRPDRLPLTADLAVLVAVAEHGGVGAGARALGLAQPNASRALRRLERQLGLELLARGARGSRLTEHGAVVVDWARHVLDANHRLLAGAAALTRPGSAEVSVAASQTIAEELLPRWLSGLHHELAHVRVQLTVGNSADVGRAVDGGATVGFVESPQLPDTLGPLDSVVVATDRLVVVVASAHPWARRTRPVTLTELAATALVVREPGSGTRVSLEQALARAGHPPVAPALELGSNAAVRVAVASGAAPAVLSEHAVEVAVARGDLSAVMVDGLVVERPLRAVWPRGHDLVGPARRLVELACEVEAARVPAPGPEVDPGWGL